MKETKLTFKDTSNFKDSFIYSVCMRGARRFEGTIDILDSFGNLIAYGEVSQQPQFRFLDLLPFDINDNYDESAIDYYGLEKAMTAIYPTFQTHEIVTIVRFYFHAKS